MTDNVLHIRQVHYLVAVDDDYKPVHTTRICSALPEAKKLRDQMAAQYHAVLICKELEG